MDRAGKGKFVCGSSSRSAADAVVELSLGLSTNGCFGSDPGTKKLKRSSSVSELDANGGGGSSAQPARASSVPTEKDENRLREMQVRRSTQARRLRMERLRLLRGVRVRAEIPPLQEEGEGASETDQETNGESENGNSGGAGVDGSPTGQSAPSGPVLDGPNEGATNVLSPTIQIPQEMVVQTPASAAHSILVANGPVVNVTAASNILVFNGPVANVTAANSILLANNGQVGNIEAAINSRNGNRNAFEEEMKKAFLNMPCVSTKAYGPNETKTEGFLYRYRSGDDIKIVCVCHGQFLTPAEFVKHGGGSDADAAHPLKHIMVLRFPHNR